MTQSIVYALEPDLNVDEFAQVLHASTLAARRPMHDPERLNQMLRHADVIATARIEGRLIGVSRAITDFSFCCYLSDLAVDAAYQHQGIGKKLIEVTHEACGWQTRLFLVAAPAAETYYPKIGMLSAPCFSWPAKE